MFGFGWLINWWKNRAREKSRAIFRYWDGKKERAIDPMLAWQGLISDVEFNLDTHPAQIDRGEIEAIQVGSRTVQRVFAVKPVDEGGLTQLESLDLLVDYFDYLDTLKKNINPMPTLPQPTALPSSVTSTTNAGSASGEMPNEPRSAEPPK